MKKLRSIVMIFFLSLILCGMTSCMVRTYGEGDRHRRHDNDEHKRGAVIVIDKDRDHRSDDNHNH